MSWFASSYFPAIDSVMVEAACKYVDIWFDGTGVTYLQDVDGEEYSQDEMHEYVKRCFEDAWEEYWEHHDGEDYLAYMTRELSYVCGVIEERDF